MEKETQVRYGRYNNLTECITRNDIYEKVIKLSDSYLLKHKKIDGVFGITVFVFLKTKGWINKNGCSEDHFGDLLIKEFGSKCSFKKGDAISDAKDTLDNVLIKEMNDVVIDDFLNFKIYRAKKWILFIFNILQKSFIKFINF